MIPVYAAIIAAALAVASAVFTFTRQQQTATLRERQQVYAALMSRKLLRNQLVVSRFEALIFSDYHEGLWRLAGAPSESLDLEEAKRWMHKSEDLALEAARTDQPFFESVGLARTVFQASPDLRKLTERLYRFRPPTIAPPPKKDAQSLEAWKTQAVSQLQTLVETEYGKPTDELLEYLDKHLQTAL